MVPPCYLFREQCSLYHEELYTKVNNHNIDQNNDIEINKINVSNKYCGENKVI